MGIQELIIISIAMIVIDVLIIGRLIIRKIRTEKFKANSTDNKDVFFNAILGSNLNIKSKTSSSTYFEIKQSIKIDKRKLKNVEKVINVEKIEKKYLKNLKSILKTKRIESIVYLGLIGTDTARIALEGCLIEEKEYTVKLYIANALTDIGNKESLSVLIASLINASNFYRDKVNMMIANFGEDFNLFLSKIIRSDKIEVKELIVDFGSAYFSEEVKKYIVELIASSDEEISKIKRLPQRNKCKRLSTIAKDVESFRKVVYKACDILAQYYPKVLDDEKYLTSKDIEIKNIAIKAISNSNKSEKIEELILFLGNKDTARSAVNTISIIIERNPGFIRIVANAFNKEKNILIKNELAEILSSKIEYFIIKLTKKTKISASEIIKQILYLGKTIGVIDFLNKNKDIDIENELIYIIREVISKSTTIAIILQNEFSKYLNERLVKKSGFVPALEYAPKNKEVKDKKLIANLYVLLVLAILIFPIIYGLRHQDIIFESSVIEQIKMFIIDFNYYLVFYSISINGIYIALLFLSGINAKKQVKLWKIKNMSLLFKRKILPSVSIIAPAFNEEKTIIESANSLLNLKYPDYELIIVNDGSKDSTLNVVIKYFHLSRVDYIFDYKLNTKFVRGIYINRSMPRLIVVDKENGGKADSLNAGINISKKKYFCGIDADSLLEDEALIKLASLTLDTGIETPALGGNIFPINGCKVEQGQIKNKSIPSNKIARFQTIEYIRAFMGGRLGWAYIRSLLIISGAFGLFRKERVIEVGGYLTSSGKYEKDTVGEDMELVVRITRFMREKGIKNKILYGFNANCWTEVPEDLKTLKKQRYRWHRGLIDILTFHKKMLFNPRYGRIGVFAIPYFFIFEMMGPLIEIQGYIMAILALMFGIMNIKIALILFISTILMGVFISVASLLIAENDLRYFSIRDMLILIGYSIIENFGPRQLFSFWRVGGYFSMLKKPVGWDKAERKGFSA